METVPVVELTRGCQYTDPNDWTGCSRLAYTVARFRVGNSIQQHMRCRDHEGLAGGIFRGKAVQILYYVSPHTMRLGYKP